METEIINIEPNWSTALNKEFKSEYFQRLISFLKKQYENKTVIYPPQSLIFNAFNLTPLTDVKVVILGQDPYHGPNEAMGLSFSVPQGIKVPPSLRNVYKELKKDLNIDIANHGDLRSWAAQGVLLLNAMLTVEHKSPGSHKKIGWQLFTDAVIKYLSDHKEGIIFMLWGNFAKSKKDLIDLNKHHILTAAHPSPLARGAYFGSKHFSKANNILIDNNQRPINWEL